MLPRIATNELQVIRSREFNPQSQQFETVERYERQITLFEWDETDAAENNLRVLEIPREMAHNWASTEEITGVLSNQGGLWNSFLNVSGWMVERPNNADLPFYRVSGDNQWWYLVRAQYAEDYSKFNPVEDWSSIWASYFTPDNSSELVRLVDKVELVDRFFDQIRVKFP